MSKRIMLLVILTPLLLLSLILSHASEYLAVHSQRYSCVSELSIKFIDQQGSEVLSSGRIDMLFDGGKGMAVYSGTLRGLNKNPGVSEVNRSYLFDYNIRRDVFSSRTTSVSKNHNDDAEDIDVLTYVLPSFAVNYVFSGYLMKLDGNNIAVSENHYPRSVCIRYNH